MEGECFSIKLFGNICLIACQSRKAWSSVHQGLRAAFGDSIAHWGLLMQHAQPVQDHGQLKDSAGEQTFKRKIAIVFPLLSNGPKTYYILPSNSESKVDWRKWFCFTLELQIMRDFLTYVLFMSTFYIFMIFYLKIFSLYLHFNNSVEKIIDLNN